MFVILAFMLTISGGRNTTVRSMLPSSFSSSKTSRRYIQSEKKESTIEIFILFGVEIFLSYLVDCRS